MAGERGWQRMRATLTVVIGFCLSNPERRMEVSEAFSTAPAMNAPLRSTTPGGVLSLDSEDGWRVGVGREGERWVGGIVALGVDALLQISLATAPPLVLRVSRRRRYFSPATRARLSLLSASQVCSERSISSLSSNQTRTGSSVSV